jgi:hypothetical protein
MLALGPGKVIRPYSAFLTEKDDNMSKSNKKLFLIQATYEHEWLVWAESMDEAGDTYWTDGKQVTDDMRWFEMDEISPEDALKRFQELPRDD